MTKEIKLVLPFEEARDLQRAITEAVEAMKEGYQIKRLCRLDEMIEQEIEYHNELEKEIEVKHLKEQLSDIQFKLERLKK